MKVGFLCAALLGAPALFSFSLACSSSTSDTPPPVVVVDDASAPPGDDADAGTSVVDAADAAGQCATTFGQDLTTGFGRLDGVVWAVQKPTDLQCTLPNSTHVVIQVLAAGAIHRMVANVQSDQGPPQIYSLTFPHALPDPAFAEGWHLGAQLDYVTTLGVHSTDAFTSMMIADATAEIVSALTVGQPVSVYATVGDTEPDSAHDIHRQKTNADGAIVLSPTSASPTFLLFHFDEQTF